MRKFVISNFLFLLSYFATAHPGIGIVKDSRGNIYYTDLKQVWKITPKGNRTAVVKEVHTHELYIDEQDNLYGEHLWYNGESKDTWGHYVWTLKSNGELVKEDPTEGFLTDYSFARDSLGNMYWVERFTTSRIMQKSKSGEIAKVIEAKFGFIGWLTSTTNGTLYFTENNKLHRLLPGGKLETLTDSLGSRSPDFSVMGHNYDSYGMWTDAHDNVYLAMIDSKKVIRVDANRKIETVLGSNSLWTICSGLFDNNGNLWVLENSVSNEVRARKISKEELAGGNIANDFTRKTHVLITIGVSILIIILLWLTRTILNKKRLRFAF